MIGVFVTSRYGDNLDEQAVRCRRMWRCSRASPRRPPVAWRLSRPRRPMTASGSARAADELYLAAECLARPVEEGDTR